MPEKNDLENGEENEVLNNFVNGVENEEENAGNHVFDAKNAGENENPFSENDPEMSVENEEKMNVENGQEIEDNFSANLENGDPFDFPEEEEPFDFPKEDPLDEAINSDPEDKPIDEIIEDLTGGSVKNLEVLEELGSLAMEKIDDSKAMLCSAISGESPANYTSDKKLNKALVNAFVNYFRSNNVKAPSPFGTLMLALAMWGLPSLGSAFFHRKKAQKIAKQQAVQKAKESKEDIEDLEIEGEAQSDRPANLDYSQLKEYQENRRIFTIHKESGCYNRTPKGQFCKTSLATEKPSPEIQAMLDEGLSSAEIRERLYQE